MTLMERRRALMGEKKDPSLLFSVKNHQFDGTASLDSGVCLMNTDKDFTIIGTFTVTEPGSGAFRFFYELESVSPWYGVNISRGSNASQLVFRWASNTDAIYNLPESGIYKIQLACTHKASSGKAVFYCRLNDAATVTVKTVTSAFRQNSTNVIFNGYNDVTRWKGSIDKAGIFNRVLSQNEVYKFFGYDPTAYVQVTALQSISVTGIKQGGCTDGTYIYQVSFTDSTYSGGVFIKYKISDGTYTTVSFSTTDFGHCNDMAYNPNNQHIYIAPMLADGTVLELDSGFNVVATHTVIDGDGNPINVWQLSFDRNNKKFYVAKGSNFVVLDQNLAYVETITAATALSASGQGGETDGSHIYRLCASPNLLDVLTMAGQRIKVLTINTNYEPESIMYDWTSEKFYISTNENSGFFYKADFTV